MIYSWKFKQCDHFKLWKWILCYMFYVSSHVKLWSMRTYDQMIFSMILLTSKNWKNLKILPSHDHTFPVRLDLMWTYLCHSPASSWWVHSTYGHLCDDILSVFLSVLHSDHDVQVWSMFHCCDHNGCVEVLLQWYGFCGGNLQACLED